MVKAAVEAIVLAAGSPTTTSKGTRSAAAKAVSAYSLGMYLAICSILAPEFFLRSVIIASVVFLT